MLTGRAANTPPPQHIQTHPLSRGELHSVSEGSLAEDPASSKGILQYLKINYPQLAE